MCECASLFTTLGEIDAHRARVLCAARLLVVDRNQTGGARVPNVVMALTVCARALARFAIFNDIKMYARCYMFCVCCTRTHRVVVVPLIKFSIEQY